MTKEYQKRIINAIYLLAESRDFIKYFSACAESAQANSKIDISAVRAADRIFSYYLKAELIDEMHAVLPDVDRVFNILSSIRKQRFFFNEFREQYESELLRGMKGLGVELTLNLLFYFSVIGNQPQQRNQTVFQYQHRNARFNFRERIIVHRGLYQSLQIF